MQLPARPYDVSVFAAPNRGAAVKTTVGTSPTTAVTGPANRTVDRHRPSSTQNTPGQTDPQTTGELHTQGGPCIAIEEKNIVTHSSGPRPASVKLVHARKPASVMNNNGPSPASVKPVHVGKPASVMNNSGPRPASVKLVHVRKPASVMKNNGPSPASLKFVSIRRNATVVLV